MVVYLYSEIRMNIAAHDNTEKSHKAQSLSHNTKWSNENLTCYTIAFP